MLETIDLTKRYDDGVLALDHLNLKVEAGETFCMFGANGAGKTTAINLLLNFIEPTEGTAVINGVDVVKEPLRSKDYISFVSENVMLYGNFTAYQNLDYFAKLAGKRDYGKDDYHKALVRVGLEESAFNRRIKNFSKGMRQKLGIAIAIVKDAPNILLDEPTSGLDPKAAVELLELLTELKEQGKTIFMSTHDIFRAKAIADRVGFLKEGRMIQMRSREELKDEDLSKLYIEYMH
ncbi:ABC transporter ATP-binding protein [candidate division KSB1 bacterium]